MDFIVHYHLSDSSKRCIQRFVDTKHDIDTNVKNEHFRLIAEISELVQELKDVSKKSLENVVKKDLVIDIYSYLADNKPSKDADGQPRKNPNIDRHEIDDSISLALDIRKGRIEVGVPKSCCIII